MSTDKTTMQAQLAGKQLKLRVPNWFIGALGWTVEFLFLMGLMAQIQTTEALYLGPESVDVFKPNWQILLQLPRMVGLIGPELTGKEFVAALVGWTIVLVYLLCVVAREVLDDVRTGSAPLFTKILTGGIIGMVVLNFWTDLQYGFRIAGENSLGAWLFAVVASLIVAFFGVIGAELIEQSWKRA